VKERRLAMLTLNFETHIMMLTRLECPKSFQASIKASSRIFETLLDKQRRVQIRVCPSVKWPYCNVPPWLESRNPPHRVETCISSQSHLSILIRVHQLGQLCFLFLCQQTLLWLHFLLLLQAFQPLLFFFPCLL
jgi:hypothetical protein